jgi:hypothetical protein
MSPPPPELCLLPALIVDPEEEVTCSSDTAVVSQRTARCNVPEDVNSRQPREPKVLHIHIFVQSHWCIIIIIIAVIGQS